MGREFRYCARALHGVIYMYIYAYSVGHCSANNGAMISCGEFALYTLYIYRCIAARGWGVYTMRRGERERRASSPREGQ